MAAGRAAAVGVGGIRGVTIWARRRRKVHTTHVIDVWTHVAAERRALADFLETLEPADWEVRSLCTEWTVRDVVGHLAWGATQPASERLGALVKGGFRVNTVATELARQWGRREPETMI